MTDTDLAAIEARAKAALAYERSEYDPAEGAYVSPATGTETGEEMTCPLCDGEGYVEGQRYDSKETVAASVVAYGIDRGLGLAEEWVEKAPADILALVAEVRQLQQALSITCEREPSKREGDAYEDKHEVSMGPVYPTGECFVARGGWTGQRCRRCTRWVWGGPTACERCVAEEERDAARSEANVLREKLEWQGACTKALMESQERLATEVVRLRGITPELPPRPDEGGGLPRYGLRWNGPTEPVAVPLADGYWTPWHLAAATHGEDKP